MENLPSSNTDKSEEQLKNSAEKLSLEQIYSDERFITLYRYENPDTSYDASREEDVLVSKREIVGQWFTDNLGDLRTYMLMRQPGGRIVVVRVPKSHLVTLDAGNRAEARNMDRELGNYIVSPEQQAETRIEIPVGIETKSSKRFRLDEMQKIDEFIGQELSLEALLSHAQRRIEAN